MDEKEIEFWEHEYLKQIYYLLIIDKQKMLDGFNTKEDIRKDWEEYLGKETLDFATGSERIFYWLFNQFGVPNSSPIGSDMFFETYNAYVHIDIKTVTKSNIGDFNRNIFVGNNQNSYEGNVITNNYNDVYKGNLPAFYTKKDGSKKLCLTYFICILYDEKDLNIQCIFITCMPNGKLSKVYGSDILSAGKNRGKIRFNYSSCKYFKLLENESLRTRILLWSPKDEETRIKLKLLEEIYMEQAKNLFNEKSDTI